jgi:hypothetical protein
MVGDEANGDRHSAGELAVVLWEWLGVHSYAELLLVAALLGIGGASFEGPCRWRAGRIQPLIKAGCWELSRRVMLAPC